MITFNGEPCIRGMLWVPYRGQWVFRGEVASAVELGGKATVTVDGVEHVGTAIGADEWRGVRQVAVLPGAAKLSSLVPAIAHRSMPVAVIASSIVQASGERLSPVVETTLVLSQWTRIGATAAACLADLADCQSRVVWRSLPDGRQWLGVDVWGTSKATILQTRDRDIPLGVDDVQLSGAVRPGQVLGSQRVYGVRYTQHAKDYRVQVSWLAGGETR